MLCPGMLSGGRGEGSVTHTRPPGASGALGASRVTPAGQVSAALRGQPGAASTLAAATWLQTDPVRAPPGMAGVEGRWRGPGRLGWHWLLSAIRSRSPDGVRGAAFYRSVVWGGTVEGVAPMCLQQLEISFGHCIS